MREHFIMLTADQDYECDTCPWQIAMGDGYVSIVHGDHRDNICLACDEKRKDAMVVDAEIVAAE